MLRRVLFIPPAVLFPLFLAAQVSSVELGDASGQPGEVVEIPLFASFDAPMHGMVITFSFDIEKLRFIDFTTQGTEAGNLDLLGILFNVLEPGRGLFGINPNRSSTLGLRVSPGDDKFVGRARFRILATAAVGPTEVAITENLGPTETGLSLEIDGKLTIVRPKSFSGADVEILPPQGPRPVGDLACVQFLDRVQLSFTRTETYDTVEIQRNGLSIALLEGAETEYEDMVPTIGRFTYHVIASRGTESSIAVECDIVTVSPAAPGVEMLECEEDLVWSNPASYDQIFVFRNGEQIAALDGDAERLADPDQPDEFTVYTVIGELKGFRSPEVNCLHNGVWVYELGDVQVPLDATEVKAPIFATTSFDVRGIEFHINIDQKRFELIPDEEESLEGTVSNPNPDLLRIGVGFLGLPSAGIAFDSLPPREPEKDLLVGLRQHVFSFNFRLKGEFADGDTFPVSFEEAFFSIQREGVAATSVTPDLLLSGEIRFGSAGLPPVEALEARVVGVQSDGGGAGREGIAGAGIELSWTNGGDYDAVRIIRNGEVAGNLSGAATEFFETDVPKGIFTYKVVGVSGDETSFPTTTFLTTISPPGAFLRGDVDRDSIINISDAVTGLIFLFRRGSTLLCEDAADINDDGRLNIADPVSILNYLFRGGSVIKSPGTRYPWFDPTPDTLTCAE